MQPHNVVEQVLIFFKFWYLDGYDFKTLRGTPLYISMQMTPWDFT